MRPVPPARDAECPSERLTILSSNANQNSENDGSDAGADPAKIPQNPRGLDHSFPTSGSGVMRIGLRYPIQSMIL